MSSDRNNQIFLVGIASSAGGLQPLRELIAEALCHDSMSFIIVPHLMRDQESIMARLLEPFSRLKVKVIEHRQRIEPCHLYVLPPNFYAVMKEDCLQLIPRPSGINQSANVLFESLAEYYGPNAIGVVLSGAAVGADGTEGVKKVKAAGGHTYAQDPKTAEHPQMPEIAIESGCIDSVLTPAQIGHELALISWTGK